MNHYDREKRRLFLLMKTLGTQLRNPRMAAEERIAKVKELGEARTQYKKVLRALGG